MKALKWRTLVRFSRPNSSPPFESGIRRRSSEPGVRAFGASSFTCILGGTLILLRNVRATGRVQEVDEVSSVGTLFPLRFVRVIWRIRKLDGPTILILDDRLLFAR